MPQVRTRQRAKKSKYFENHSDLDLSTASSIDEFLPSPKIKTTLRRTARKSNAKRNLKEPTESAPKAVKRSTRTARKKIKSEAACLEQINSASESTDEDEFEEVPNLLNDDVNVPISTQMEIEFMGKLFTKDEEELTEVVDKGEIKVSVSTVKTKSTNRDPEVLAALANARELRQRARFVHSFHVMCFLTLGRFINRLCDDPLIRALGLSLIEVSEVKDVSSLRFLVLSFVSLIKASREVKVVDMIEGIQSRLKDGFSSADDCCILMVAGLRALGFDTRLVLAFAPPPLKPPKSKPIKTLKPLKETHSDKIISSDSDDDIQVESKFMFSAEVYLSSDRIWYSLDLSPPVGKVTAEFSSSPFHYPYVVAFTSTENGYLGRSPIDLAPRYDPTWMSASRCNRIPDAQYQQFLSSIKYYCDGDVVNLRERDNTKAEERRDTADTERTFDYLRTLPLPTKVQDFKNHPLYVLRRHLLKFEVIYPDDAPVIGFFKVGAKANQSTEPVYPRECVHLCHTRESWLKEAKIVRIGEKPAKIVKAMMTIKRKLLQDQDGKQPMVELFGPWQVDDYVPPVAKDGVVPRNEHGNVELFKACMLPIGCVHIRLPGIQHIMKQLHIDFAPAMIGWSFGKAGWAHPEYDGFVVCKEVLPALLDAWRAVKMNAEAAEAADRSERALANWKILTKHLLLWRRVEERFQLSKSAHVKPKVGSNKHYFRVIDSFPLSLHRDCLGAVLIIY
ncbi:unnamed protein product [Rodentolepis nana]|uniref:DNA repair protein complementing XP-C cells n=1 Tax=Rodentolepis nana TaxID=102285 RepID=A0A0R3T2M9_RODNA|nr:unnamed protein product [Rodentolepis nana]